MALIVKPKGAYKKFVHTQQGLFNQILITKSIPISINNIGNSIKETLEKAIAFQVEGKCIVEGYIKPNTVEIITFSSGLVQGSIVVFDVVFQCYVCSPVEGMHINCIAKHINKAGIRAEIDETPTPVVIFIARDHNYTSPLFAQIKENDEIKVRVIGQRFELNDKYISIIAELIEQGTNKPPANALKQQQTSVAAAAAALAAKNKGKTGKLTVTKKISIAKEISTELAKEIEEEVENAGQIEEVKPVAEAQAVVEEEVVPIVEEVAPVAEEVAAPPVTKKRATIKLKKTTTKK
jgi:DNA-directed RNA polymerase subunit E'/Rpb7